MDRRTFLRAGLTGPVAAAVAGCTASTAPPPALHLAGKGFRFDGGSLVVTATVANASDAGHAATLVFAPEVNGETKRRTRSIALDAHATRVYETAYDGVSKDSAKSVTVHAHLEDVR